MDTTQLNTSDKKVFSPSPTCISNNDASEMSSATNVIPVFKYNTSTLHSSEYDCCDITDSTEALEEYLVTDNTIDIPEKNQPKPPCHCHGLMLGNCPKHIKNVVETARNVVASGVANRDGVRKPVGFLNTEAWKDKLAGYDDLDDVLSGIEFGWELGRNEHKLDSSFKNHQ